jgi:hypothetical protein
MPLPFLPGLPLTFKTFLEIFTAHSYTLIVKEVFFMNVRRKVAFISLFFSIAFLMPCQGWAQLFKPPEPRPGSHAPIITHAFAVEKGYYGYIWKIYIEAEDLDGDMLRIASVADEVGYGHYPTDWIYLKPQYQKHFKGYLQWNTFSTMTSYLQEWTQITLKVSVLDKAGNESNIVVFPFTFEVVKNQYKYGLPPPFDQGDLPRLGYININLMSPNYGYGRGGRND